MGVDSGTCLRLNPDQVEDDDGDELTATSVPELMELMASLGPIVVTKRTTGYCVHQTHAWPERPDDEPN